jgi:hypothetical protein
MAMSDALKVSPQSPFLLFGTPGSKRKQESSAAEVGQSELTSKKARRETNKSPVPCSSLSPGEFDHEDTGTGKETEPVTADSEPQPEDAEAELSASVPPISTNQNFKPSIRTTPKGLDRTYLRVFQAYAYD